MEGSETAWVVTNFLAEHYAAQDFCVFLNPSNPAKEILNEILRNPFKIKLFAGGRAQEWGGILHYAIMGGDMQQFERALEAGAWITDLDIRGRTPLHVAIHEGRLDMIKILTNYPSHSLFTTRNIWGRSACDEAVLRYMREKIAGGDSSSKVTLD